LQYVLLFRDPLDEPNACQRMRLEHLIQFLQKLHKCSHVFELKNDILSQNRCKLYGLEANIQLFQAQIIYLILDDLLIEDVLINARRMNHLLLVFIIRLQSDA